MIKLIHHLSMNGKGKGNRIDKVTWLRVWVLDGLTQNMSAKNTFRPV